MGSAIVLSLPRETNDELIERWPCVRPFLVVGTLCIVAGGVVAAVTRPTGFVNGSWLAAYLVLVGGVAQIFLGLGQAWLAAEPPPVRAVIAELVAWNLAAAAVIAGTLLTVPVLTTLGGVCLVVALLAFIVGVRGAARAPRWAYVVYRALTAIVLVSTPIGLAMAWIRHG